MIKQNKDVGEVFTINPYRRDFADGLLFEEFATKEKLETRLIGKAGGSR